MPADTRAASFAAPALPPPCSELAALGVQRRYRTHALLIDEGDHGDSVYIVLSGRLRAFVSDARGARSRWVITGRASTWAKCRSTVVRVRPACRRSSRRFCAVVTRETMLRHIAADPEFALGLIVRLIRRARLATESARSMALLDVYSRLRRLLEERAQVADGTRRIAERLTHQAIATRSGVRGKWLVG